MCLNAYYQLWNCGSVLEKAGIYRCTLQTACLHKYWMKSMKLGKRTFYSHDNEHKHSTVTQELLNEKQVTYLCIIYAQRQTEQLLNNKMSKPSHILFI